MIQLNWHDLTRIDHFVRRIHRLNNYPDQFASGSRRSPSLHRYSHYYRRFPYLHFSFITFMRNFIVTRFCFFAVKFMAAKRRMTVQVISWRVKTFGLFFMWSGLYSMLCTVPCWVFFTIVKFLFKYFLVWFVTTGHQKVHYFHFSRHYLTYGHLYTAEKFINTYPCNIHFHLG